MMSGSGARRLCRHTILVWPMRADRPGAGFRSMTCDVAALRELARTAERVFCVPGATAAGQAQNDAHQDETAV